MGEPRRPIDGVRISARELPAAVADARRAAAADNAAYGKITKPWIDAVLAAYKLVAQNLVGGTRGTPT